ncbi:MAG: hypothetical protein ACLU86_11630 [Negativibacillus massiliensis]|uniref:hypothetical protein n=1 Tax=Negativibacillus massiliensis TaxID=1871035 RepID=UPI00399B8B2C
MEPVFRISKPEKKIVIPLRMKEKNISQITQIAKQIGISRNEWIVQAIEYVLDNMEEKEE